MARHYNISLGQWLLRTFRFKGGDYPTDEVANFIQPVVSVEPVLNWFATNTTVNSGSMVLGTSPSDKDLYIFGVQVTIEKNGASDNVVSAITATVNGTVTTLAQFGHITLTAKQLSQVVMFPKPIKVDRNTNISMSGSYTVGALTRSGTVMGYTTDTLVSSTA